LFCRLQDLRQIRTKPGQPLSALKGLNLHAHLLLLLLTLN
jgi:hypothetical protein